MLAEFETFHMATWSTTARTSPLRVLWGDHGAVGKSFDMLALWRARASNVAGHRMPCGHYIAQESPAFLLQEAMEFFRRDI